jgi:hypothetical protein
VLPAFGPIAKLHSTLQINYSEKNGRGIGQMEQVYSARLPYKDLGQMMRADNQPKHQWTKALKRFVS